MSETFKRAIDYFANPVIRSQPTIPYEHQSTIDKWVVYLREEAMLYEQDSEGGPMVTIHSALTALIEACLEMRSNHLDEVESEINGLKAEIQRLQDEIVMRDADDDTAWENARDRR